MKATPSRSTNETSSRVQKRAVSAVGHTNPLIFQEGNEKHSARRKPQKPYKISTGSCFSPFQSLSMNFPTQNPVYQDDEDDQVYSPTLSQLSGHRPSARVSRGEMRPSSAPTAFHESNHSLQSNTEHSSTTESNDDPFAWDAPGSPKPSTSTNIGYDRPPAIFNKSWRPKDVLDDSKYSGFKYGEVKLKKTQNGLKVSNGLQLESPIVERRKWEYGFRWIRTVYVPWFWGRKNIWIACYRLQK